MVLYGKVIPEVEIKISDKDEDGIGEILVKGDNITKGYFENEIKTEEVVTNGWMHTGDLGKIDNEGYIYICGRNSEMIVLSNGKKVFPNEIETELNKIDGVKESFVFEKNNKINAKVVYSSNIFKESTDNEIYSFIMEKVKKLNESLPQFKKINDVIVTCQELEKTLTGKVKRNIELEKIKEDKNEKNVDNDVDVTFKRIKKILINKLGNKQISEESNIVSDLGADSLDIVEIILDIEREFGIEIKKEQRKKIAKVKDLLDIVNIK